MRAESEINNPERLCEDVLAFAASKRDLRYSTPESLVDTVIHLFKIVRLSDKNFAIKAYLDLIREVQSLEGKPECFEDEFVLAVAFVDLEVSKIGAVTYLKGESSDFKEQRRKRTMLNTAEDTVLKNLSAGLGRPNERRGRVEKDLIRSAHKRMAGLINLHNTIPEVARALEAGMTKEAIMNTIRIGPLKEKMTLTHYDHIMRMGRREKHYSAFKVRAKNPNNNFELSVENLKRVTKTADERGLTPRRALNDILDTHFATIESRKLFTPIKKKN